MDAMLCQNTQLDIMDKIKSATYLCRITRFEKMLSDCFENMEQSDAMDYLGELNKNDILS